MAKRLKGLDKVVKNLNDEIRKLKKRSNKGLLAAGLIVQRAAQEKVPVEYGNLRGSAYTQPSPTKEGVVQVGFGAAYAAAVHENIEQKWKGEPRKSGLGVYWGPSGEPKFLEKALAENHDTIIRVLANATEL